MLSTVRRYLRAFIVALRFTLRGEQPPLLLVRAEHPGLAAWWTETLRRVAAVERAAAALQLDPQTLLVHVDKRDLSMATILATVKYHADHEYPYLMLHHNSFEKITLQSLNLNDRYLVAQLADAADPSLKPSIKALGAHLEALPNESN